MVFVSFLWMNFGLIKNLWAMIRKELNETFNKIKLSVRDKVLKLSTSGKTARFYMKVDWFVESEGEKYKFDDVRTTGVLKNEGGKWRIVQFHTSLPVEGQAVKY